MKDFAVFHAVAIDDRVLIGKIRFVSVVHKGHAEGVAAFLDVVIQVIVVVFPLHHGKGEGCPGDFDPGHQIGVIFFQGGDFFRRGLIGIFRGGLFACSVFFLDAGFVSIVDDLIFLIEAALS